MFVVDVFDVVDDGGWAMGAGVGEGCDKGRRRESSGGRNTFVDVLAWHREVYPASATGW
jgi:hypothetical protein